MLDHAQKQRFATHGYVVVEGILTDELLTAMRDASRMLGSQEPARWGWNERACFRHSPFRRLLDVTSLIDIARQLVGDDVQLLQLDLLRVHARQGARDWHRDVELVFERTLCVSCAIYLQETSPEVGPLRVMPDSHRWKQSPRQGDATPHPDEAAIPVPAGAAIFHDSGMWHTASPNASPADCWGLFPIFGPYWVKRRDHGFMQPLPAELLLTKDPLKRQLLGLQLQPGAPTYLGDSDEYNRRGDAGIDFSAG
jgi:ectoine hydroxylase-related dioxygenase (phytanoyl-CoA dioxygenase family)